MNNDTTDKIVLDLFNKVKAMRKEIEATQRPQWETSCTFGYNPDTITDRINIQVVADVAKLIDIHSFLRTRYIAFKDSAIALGVPNTHFKWMGYSITQWNKDIETRVAQISVTTKKKDLASFEERLNKLITVEQRRVIELEDIQKELADK